MVEEIVSLIDPEPPDRYRFDYKGMHRYTVTLPVYGSKKVFTEQQRVVAVLNCLRDVTIKHKFDVYAYCFLPDQLLLIVRGKSDDANLKEFLADFRASSSAGLQSDLGHPLWKKKYLERVLRKTEDTRRIAEQLFRAPVKAGLVKSDGEYPFQGSFVVGPTTTRSRADDAKRHRPRGE